MKARRTTGIHGQRIMTVLSSPPFSFGFERARGDDQARAQIVGTSKAPFCTTTTVILRGDRDDLDMIEISVLSGPPEYVRHTQLGFGIMAIVAKLASSDVIAWLEEQLPIISAGKKPDQLRTGTVGRLRLTLRTQQVNAAALQVVFAISPAPHEPPAGTIERIPIEEPA